MSVSYEDLIRYQETVYVTDTGNVVAITGDYRWRVELYGYESEEEPSKLDPTAGEPTCDIYYDGEREGYFHIVSDWMNAVEAILGDNGTPPEDLIDELSHNIVAGEA